MKLILASILALLMLTSAGMAAMESRQVGPYTVSFNVDTPMNYNIEVPQPVQGPEGIVYPLTIRTDDMTVAQIIISESMNQTDATKNMWTRISWLTMRTSGLNASAPRDMPISGRDGFVVAGRPFDPAQQGLPADFMVYNAKFWLDAMPCECGPVSIGRTMVDISSSYPETTTMTLLNTLTIQTGGQQAMTTAPTADMTGMMGQPMQGQPMQGQPATGDMPPASPQ